MEKPESLPKEKKEMKSKKDEGNDGPTVESTLNELKYSIGYEAFNIDEFFKKLKILK